MQDLPIQVVEQAHQVVITVVAQLAQVVVQVLQLFVTLVQAQKPLEDQLLAQQVVICITRSLQVARLP
jgi:hypothetical protein